MNELWPISEDPGKLLKRPFVFTLQPDIAVVYNVHCTSVRHKSITLIFEAYVICANYMCIVQRSAYAYMYIHHWNFLWREECTFYTYGTYSYLH